MNRICLPRNPFTALTQLVNGKRMPKSDSVRSLGMPNLEGGVRTVANAIAQYQWAKQCVHAAKERMKARHDAKALMPRQYKVGDMVWFNRKNLNLRHPSRRHKLVPRFLGCHTLIKCELGKE